MKVEFEYKEESVEKLKKRLLRATKNRAIVRAITNAKVVPAYIIHNRRNNLEIVEADEVKFEEEIPDDELPEYLSRYYVISVYEVSPIVTLKVRLNTYEEYKELRNILEREQMLYCGLTAHEYVIYIVILSSRGTIYL